MAKERHITDFGMILRNLRCNLGMTITQVAREIGKSQAYITSVERGTSTAPKRDTLRAWLKALHCSERFEELNDLAILNRTSIHTRLIPKDASNEDIVRVIEAYKNLELSPKDRLILSCLCRE